MGSELSYYPTECPACTKTFPPGTKQDDITSHVNYCLTLSSRSSSDLPFEKHTNFRSRLSHLKTPWQRGAKVLRLRREELLQDSLQQLLALSPEAIRGELKIAFAGEDVSDAGGAVKEWLSKVNDTLLSTVTGLYRFTATENLAYRFRSCLSRSKLDLAYLHGMVLGKALLDGVPVNCPLTVVLWKRLKKQLFDIQDLLYVDQSVYKALAFVHGNDVSTVLFNHFTVEEENEAGEKVEIPLCDEGENIPLTEENKQSYISLMTEWHLTKNCEGACQALEQGFERVVPRDLIADCTVEELQAELCGLSIIDINDWKANTEYRGEYHANHPIIQFFWSVLSEFSQSDLSLLLKFVMGTSRLPIEGFRTLTTLRGDSAKFTIQSVQYDDREKYPKAHTCFNRMDLPMYPSKEALRECLKFVVTYHCEGFGIE